MARKGAESEAFHGFWRDAEGLTQRPDYRGRSA